MVDHSLPREQQLNAALELFHFAYRAFTAKPDAILAERGLARVHHRILYFVARHPGLSVNALLRILGVSKQALHGPLRQLQQLDLVAATTDAEDRRIRRLTLTGAGQALEAQLSTAQREQMAAVFASTGATAEQQWRTVMAQLAGPAPEVG